MEHAIFGKCKEKRSYFNKSEVERDATATKAHVSS